MRKVLSFVLVLALVLGSFSMAFADSHMFSDMSGEASSEAVTVLKELGVVAGYPDGTFRPDQIVTRAEMARFIVAALGLEQFAIGTTSKYPDMVQAPWAQGVVAYGTSLGFISGYPDGTFKPNQQVSFQEAASMLVRALGYTEAFLPGGWPAEWMIKANSLGIFDDVTMASGAAGADRGSIAQMLYNALDLEIGQVNSDNDWKAFVPSDTMLIRLGAKQEPARIINNADADNAMFNIRAYLGAYVVPFTKDGDIISIGEVKSTFLTGDYTTSTGIFKAGGVEYKLTSTAAITSPGGLMIVNGIATDAAGDTPFGVNHTGVTLAVKLSGKTITDVYSVTKWENPLKLQFKTSNANEIKNDMSLGGRDFAVTDDDEIDMLSFVLLGVSSLDKIAVDNVVYVWENVDGIAKIEVGTKVVTGKVTTVTTGSTPKYTINGVAYEADGPAPVLGDEGTAYLNYKGKIAYWSKTDGLAGNYAVKLMEPASDGGYVATYKIKVLLADDTEKVLSFKDSAATAGALSSVVQVGELMTYELNSAGEITSATKGGVDLVGTLNASRTIFAGKLIDAKVVVFVNDSGTYSVGSLSDIKTGTSMTLEVGYNSDNKIDAIVVDVANTEFTNTYGFALSTNGKTLNADDDTVQVVKALINGVIKDYLADTVDVVASDKNVLNKFTFDGDVITNSVPATMTTSAAVFEAGTNDVLVFAKAWTVVAGVDGDRINVGTVDNPNYQLVAGADFYVATFTAAGAFDGYAVGNLGAIGTGYHVVLVQTDTDSDNWDLVLYIKTADIGKGTPFIF
jgi:hypothetical protein